MTPGERRLAQRLESKLEEDYLLWYDVPVGSKRLHPDFIVLHPLRGLIVLEVKDWKLDTIQTLDRITVTLCLPHGPKTVANPLRQARDYALAIAHLLEQDPLLVQGAGIHQGKLAFPYSYGVVLSHITRKQFEASEGLQAVLEPHLVICQNEIFESVDPLAFQERLWNLCTYTFGEPLTPAQVDRIRWHLFPEVRIGVQLSLLPDEPSQPETLTVPDLIRVMDLQQEQLARSLGEGHRVIHGVAGSGKTLVLVYRCLHLAQTLDKPILVLCFNVSLAAKLRQVFHEKGVEGDRIAVRHFHGWCNDLLWQYRIPKPSPNEFRGTAYTEELVQRVIQAVEVGKIPAGQYGAVLIDEGHDFHPEWLKLAVQMVDPETDALLLLYDDAQSIYEKQQKQKFSFRSLGIQAQGRTTILKVNYRNTDEILQVASAFARELLTPDESSDEDSPVRVQPITAGRHGALPELIKLPNFQAETHYLVERVQQFHAQGTPWNQIAVLYRAKWMAENLSDRFQQAGIPVEWVNQNSTSRNYDPAAESIKLVTMHSSKGLEFPVVCIPGLGYLPNSHAQPEDEARLLYVAMTRAVDHLVLTCDRESTFVMKLKAVSGL